MEFCGEPDEFRKGKIEIADLQICSEQPIDELVQNRKDMAKIFKKASEENIPYEKLFETVKRRAQDIPDKCFTAEAKSKFLLKHGNLAVISGRPGIGKTTLTKRILHEMWTDSLFNPDIIFFIQFRELDYDVKTDFLNFLVPLLPKSYQNENRKQILERIEKLNNVYIIMDGFDEAKIHPKKKFKPCSIHCTNTAEGFIYNLLAGNILPRCKKLITSRPYRIAELHKHFEPDILLSIQGLDKKGFGQICLNICDGNKKRCKKILQYLKAHPDIKSYCHTPVICIMVMESLNKMYEVEENRIKDTKKVDSLKTYNNASYTLTGIFVSALKEWLLDKLSLNTYSFNNICAFALSKFDQNRFYFTEFELREAGIEEHYITTFLSTILKGIRSKKMYFIHLMWQEFLAAIKLRLYTTDFENEESQINILSKLNSKKYKMVTTKFLFGLCNEDTLNPLLQDLEIEKGLSNPNNRLNCQETLKDFTIKTLETIAGNCSKNWNAGETVSAPSPASDDVPHDSSFVADAHTVDETNVSASADTVNAGVAAEDESNDNDPRQNSDGGESENESASGSNIDGEDDNDDVNDDKSYFGSILPVLGWVYEVRDDNFTKRAARYLLSEIDIENEQILPSDIPVINHVLRARTAKLALKLRHLRFVGNCSRYFFEKLQETLTVNHNIQVSYM